MITHHFLLMVRFAVSERVAGGRRSKDHLLKVEAGGGSWRDRRYLLLLPLEVRVLGSTIVRHSERVGNLGEEGPRDLWSRNVLHPRQTGLGLMLVLDHTAREVVMMLVC